MKGPARKFKFCSSFEPPQPAVPSSGDCNGEARPQQEPSPLAALVAEGLVLHSSPEVTVTPTPGPRRAHTVGPRQQPCLAS